MTVKEVQELVEAWTCKHSDIEGNNLDNMAQCVKNIGELSVLSEDRSIELSELLWQVVHIANCSNIDLTAAIIDNLERRNGQV